VFNKYGLVDRLKHVLAACWNNGLKSFDVL